MSRSKKFTEKPYQAKQSNDTAAHLGFEAKYWAGTPTLSVAADIKALK